MNTNVKNKSLQAINDKAAKIAEDAAEKRAEILQAIEDAKTAKQAAEETKDTTLNESEFAAAEKAIAEAESREAFNTRVLEHMDTHARMSEKDYDKAVATCKGIVLTARDDARARAKKAMLEIKSALGTYSEIVNEANATLEQLDAAAQVLQAKYPDKITRYTTSRRGIFNEIKTPDPNAWKQYKTRFASGDLFMGNSEDDSEDEVIYANAWMAINRVWPDAKRCH